MAPAKWIPDSLQVTQKTLPEIKTIAGKAIDAGELVDVMCSCLEFDRDLNGEIMNLGKELGFFKALSTYNVFNGEADAKKRFMGCMQDMFIRHLAVLNLNLKGGDVESFNPYNLDGDIPLTGQNIELTDAINIKFGNPVRPHINPPGYHFRVLGL